ncbi:hypothetical protein BJ322DRAFT_1213591 [Thelephora terrestris]|uniref:NB-ARC domain-containing protein n=1 Tax=Thelephora terrestris TaxID=56493 RepID=A0A9P6H8H0_9AGAM|nr:hypothetical protein BJ322DRAFT_1213591 [Thelephora terrestris]
MSSSSHGTSGPGGRAGYQPAVERPISTEQSLSNEVRRLNRTVQMLHEESSATKENIDALLKELDRLGLGVDSGDTAREVRPTQSAPTLTALEEIRDKLQALSDRIENVGRMGSNEEIKDLSALIDGIRDIVADRQYITLAASIPGESPPPAPRDFFGREDLIEKIVGLAENLVPIALVGAGGIGKTAIALTVLHHGRIKERFRGHRRFIRCDQFTASRANFLRQLSKVIGAGVENPEDLASLRSFLSSKETLIVLDNVESILDPQGTDARDIHTVVRELSQFSNICLCVTSRISNVPPHCKRLEIPTLSMEAAQNVFYSIYGDGDRSGIIDTLLQRLDFHALSITLLATTASDNLWSFDRLAQEWDEQRTQVLRTDYDESLAATIDLSLTSPTFRRLGPNARDLLGVVAFFPRGINERNLDWLFPTVLSRKTIFDKFCTLSLTYRSNGFVTMLAPIRDYLSPQDPKSSPVLRATKDHYFTRLSVEIRPSKPGFGDTQWIKSEDENVEHLLDVFTSINANAIDVWDACFHFMEHLYWQKPRQTMLRFKIENLPNGHPSKVKCLFKLSQLFGLVGNDLEEKRLLDHTLTLGREQGDGFWIALALQSLSRVSWKLRLPEEGIPQAEEALERFKQLGITLEQGNCLDHLARLLLDSGQPDAASDVVLRKIELLPEKGEEFSLCQSHHLLGEIHRFKGEKEKATHHFETALTIASPFNWQGQLFRIHYDMARLFHDENKLDDADAQIGCAKSHAAGVAYYLARGTELQALVWYRQRRLEDARAEILRASEIYQGLGLADDAEDCRRFMKKIETAMESWISGNENSSALNSQGTDQANWAGI